jgi:hypothetical protein
MPHREQKHLDELSKSLKKIENHNITNIVLTGHFNCPDIRWDTQTACGPDREIRYVKEEMKVENVTKSNIWLDEIFEN